jgi:hypothetical protein
VVDELALRIRGAMQERLLGESRAQYVAGGTYQQPAKRA